MKDNSNFFDLLNYSSTGSLDNYTKNNALKEIQYYKNFSNIETYDVIDYEKLIYIELRFIDDQDIQDELISLKQIICKNYITKYKLLNKLQLNKN